jgi:hypothetical protein
MDQPVEEFKGSAEEPVSRMPAPGRVRGMDGNYGLVLVAILVTLVLIGVLSETAAGKVLVVALLLGVLFLTLIVSGVKRRTILFLTAVIPVSLAFGAASATAEAASGIGGLSLIVSAALVVACVVVIVRRIVHYTYISLRLVYGTLCIYLLGAVLFALVYLTIHIMGDAPFFVQTEDPTGVELIYFSFITISTTGYGDYTPLSALGKMVAVVEAVSGQLYLVTVVALFVANIGRRRGSGRLDGRTTDQVTPPEDF